MSPDDRYFDPDFKDEVDRRIAAARGWTTNGFLYLDGDRDTGFSCIEPEWGSGMGRYKKFTPTEYIEQAIESVQDLAAIHGLRFSMALDGPTWEAGFEVRGDRNGFRCRQRELRHAVCDAIIKLDDHQRRKPPRRQEHRRGGAFTGQ
jgi:hypothetical protein